MSITASLSRLILQAKANTPLWKKAFFSALGILVGINLFLHPHHAHFAMETITGFWAIFGVGVCVAMILVLKKIIFLLINKPEAFYDRSE
jgi:uncharacterized membrane protein HdeD (DUF308 family)